MQAVYSLLLLSLAACAARADIVSGKSIEVANLDGDVQRPLDLDPGQVHVLLFVTTDCPIANAYVPEIRAITSDYAQMPVRFFLVQVDPEVTAEKARCHQREYGYTGLEIVRDPEHRLVAATGVSITPEAAVFSSEGMVYRGRIDNWYGDLGRKRAKASSRELRAALDAALSGEEVSVPRTEAVGCFIADFRPESLH